jgi:two-component system response regulator YesN
MLVELERQIRTMPRNAAIHCLSVLTQEYLTCEKDAQTSLTRALDCEQAAGPSGWVMLYGFQNSEELDNYLIKLGTLICGCLLREQRRNKRDLLARAKEYIQEHVTEAPALSEVAEKIGVSQNYLSVLFRRENTGFTEYMTEQRIAKACEMIRSGEGKISEISEKVGYTTPQYFSKVFKKVMGVRPSEYEQRMTGGHQNDTDL